MTKKGKTVRPAIEHRRSLKDGTYIEQRGLRWFELHTKKPPGKRIVESEDPLNKGSFLPKPLKGFLTRQTRKRSIKCLMKLPRPQEWSLTR